MAPVAPPNEEIDRIAPTRRPSARTVMRQDWHDLLFLHWIVPIEALQSLLPPGLTLDTFEGRAYIGLVPFTMRNVRPIWSPPVPGLSHFHEVNVRTYVHRNGRDPGVWFFSLDAANAIAVQIARTLFKLPYFYARMRLTKTPAQQTGPGPAEPEPLDSPRLEYASERLWPTPVPAHCDLAYRPEGEIAPAVPGTLAHFLVERYLLYSANREQLYIGQVHHASYPLQTARLESLDENLVAAAGIARPDTPPLVHYAREVRVTIHPLRRCP